MKQIKDGKRSNLSSDSLEKMAILFTTAYLEQACYALMKHVMEICFVMMISGKNVLFFYCFGNFNKYLF